MKKILIAICLACLAFWSVGASAMSKDIGVVNMQTVFKTAPKARKMNAELKKEFSGRKADIFKMGKELRQEIQNYKKNQAVLGKTKLIALQQKINQQGMKFRQAQMKFRSDLVAAQNKKMAAFLSQVREAAEKVAKKKGLDIVLPNNAVLYSSNAMDITSEVLSALE